MSRFSTRSLLGVMCLFASSACGDDDKDTTTALDSSVPLDAAPPVTGQQDAGTPTPIPPAADHVYALHYSVVMEGDNRISYVYLSKTLDLPERIDVGQSREFFGYANSTVVAGHLLMSEEASVMKKYAISSDLKWSEVAKISFAGYEDLEDVGFWRQAIGSPTSAFLLHNTTTRLIWDPTNFKIAQDVKETQLPLKRDSFDLSFSAHRDPSPNTPWRGPILRPFAYAGEDAKGEWTITGDSKVVRYAPDTYAEAAVYDVPCPDLQVPSQDEQGNTYYSGQGYQAHGALFNQGTRPCIAKFDATGTYDPSFTTDLSTLTGGRLVGTFRYVRNGIAFATVLHHEEVSADFTKPLEKATDTELGKHWYLWVFDLNAKTAKKTSIPTPVPRAFSGAEFGDRWFFMPVPWDAVSEVQNYELALDGTATPRFKTPGFAYTFAQVR